VAVARDERRCEACGATFGCGAATGSCWCAEVDVTPATLEALREGYATCLCPACLSAAAAEEPSLHP
jgi:Cysteine-rich CWC